MGSGTAKRAPAKDGRSPVATRRSASKSIKGEKTPSPSPAKSASGRKRGGATPRTGFTHRLPTAEERKSNGRVAGRSLIVWGRPRMAEKLLLHVQYECARHKVFIPWDTVAHRLHPGSSGAAIIQHLNRIRRELVAKGHLVPPLTTRSGGCNTENSDPTVRGFVRTDMDGEDKESVRPVGFDELMDDRKFNLPSVDNFDAIPENPELEFESIEDTENEGDLPQLDSNSPSDDSPKSENYTYQSQHDVSAYPPLQEAASFVNPDPVHPDLDAVPPTADEKFFPVNSNPSQQYHDEGDIQNHGYAFPAFPFPNVNPMIYNQGLSAEPFPFPPSQGQNESFEHQASFFAGNGTAGPKGGYAGPAPVFPHPGYPYSHPWFLNPMNYQPFLPHGPKIEKPGQQLFAGLEEEEPRSDDSFVVQDSQLEQPNIEDLFNTNHLEEAALDASLEESTA